MDQVSFAINSGIGPRTYVDVERGKAVSASTRRKIIDYLSSNEKITNFYGDEVDIISDLEPIEDSHRSHGRVDSNHAKEEFMKYDHDRVSDIPHTPRVHDPYIHIDENQGYKWIEQSDYSQIRRNARAITTSDEDINYFIKALSKENKIWTSTNNLSSSNDNDALKALKNLENVIKNIDVTSVTSSSLSERISQISIHSSIVDSCVELAQCGYHFFTGMQNLHFAQIPIFFIEEISVKTLTYEVESIHPRFMQNKFLIPYFTFREDRHLQNLPFLIAKAARKDASKKIATSGSEQEKKWFELCEIYLSMYSLDKREEYNESCREHIKKYYEPGVNDAFEKLSKEIQSIPF
jgi:hypothetical protein